MRRKILILLFLMVILAVGALIALNGNDLTENVLSEDGILLCEIEGIPYYYNTEYLFKVIGSVFPEEPSVTYKKLAVFCELAYLESVASDAHVTSDRLEKEIEIRETNKIVAEDLLSSSESDEEGYKIGEEYLAMLDSCCKSDGVTADVFWDDAATYVEKGILISMYTAPLLDEFIIAEDWSMDSDRYEAYLLENYESLRNKYNIEMVDEALK